MLYDLKNAFRLLVKKPGFRIVAIATLALGVGGTTAIFNVVNGVLLRSLPYHEPDRILFVQEYNPELEVPARWTSSLNFRDFRERNQVFQSMVAWRWSTFSLTGGDNPERLSGYLVSAGFFPLLGVNPDLGRGFLEEEDQPGGAKAVVISHRFWQRRFGGDPKTVGLALEVDGTPHTIVGIAPEGFAYPDEERKATATRRAKGELAASLDPETQDRRNYRYTGAGSSSVQPVEIFDNGSHTFMKFAENQTFPAIFALGADGETLVNRTVRGNWLIVPRVGRAWRLRHGKEVLCIRNEAFAPNGRDNPAETTDPRITREAR